MKRFGREIALVTLPVLIFGGLAWWKTRGGSMAQLQGAPSDGTCWPLQIDTQVERVRMQTEDFGAAK